MNIAFVSTMNQRLYDLYGQRFIEEFSSNADGEIKLFIIFEGEIPKELINDKNNIFCIPLLSEKHNLFLKFFGKLFEARGIKVKFFKEAGEQKINVSNNINFLWKNC